MEIAPSFLAFHCTLLTVADLNFPQDLFLRALEHMISIALAIALDDTGSHRVQVGYLFGGIYRMQRCFTASGKTRESPM